MARDNTASQSGEAVYERYASALSRYLVRRAPRPEDVDDLTQDIFELFVKRKDRAEVIRNPLAYLFRIAFHVVGSALTNDRRHAATFDTRQSLEDTTLDGPGSSGDDAEELVAVRDVQAALAQLPQNYLMALMLVEGEGMSYKEAAQASGFTPNTIATYVKHARAMLKLALDGHWKTTARNEGGTSR